MINEEIWIIECKSKYGKKWWACAFETTKKKAVGEVNRLNRYQKDEYRARRYLLDPAYSLEIKI